jgi:hypothetical protein
MVNVTICLICSVPSGDDTSVSLLKAISYCVLLLSMIISMSTPCMLRWTFTQNTELETVPSHSSLVCKLLTIPTCSVAGHKTNPQGHHFKAFQPYIMSVHGLSSQSCRL